MSEEIRYAALIRAALDGETIQNFWLGKWSDMPAEDAIAMMVRDDGVDGAWRIKPKVLKTWLTVQKTNDGLFIEEFGAPSRALENCDWHGTGKRAYRMEFDPEADEVTLCLIGGCF